MRNKTETTVITCDLCGRECEPVTTMSIPHSYYMDLVNCVVINAYAHVPYGTPKGDVCNDCLKQALKKAMDRL